MESIQQKHNFVQNVMKISIYNRGGSSVGRATGLQSVGHRFDSYSLHQKEIKARVIVELEKSRLASFRTVLGLSHNHNTYVNC